MAATSSSFSTSSSSSPLLLLITALSFLLAAFAFILQWRGQLPDSFSHWRLERDYLELSSMVHSEPIPSSSSSSDCVESILGKSRTLPFQHYRDWKFILEARPESDNRTKVCITSTTSAGLEQILPWLFYHKVVGVTNFFLFVEGKAASTNVSRVLKSIPGVKVIHRTRELEEQQANSRIWNETWLEADFYRPCNYELFVKQTFNMEMAITMAKEARMDWIIHIDTDELLHPAGTSDYSVQQYLSDMPENVDMVVFVNYESTVERDDIKDPFSEVSMFKKGFHHINRGTFFGSHEKAKRDNPDYFLTCANGKSAARIQDHLRPNGAHRWHNYMKNPIEIYSDEAAVLHYTYAKFSDLTSRRDRCRCKPTKEGVKRCFMLEFDRNAFMIASTLTKEEMLLWYREHVVWTDKELTDELLKRGILTRIYSPMVIVQGLRESGIFAYVISSAFSKTVEHA